MSRVDDYLRRAAAKGELVMVAEDLLMPIKIPGGLVKVDLFEGNEPEQGVEVQICLEGSQHRV